MSRLLVALTALVIGATASADVQIKMKGLHGSNSTISSDGRRARIEDDKMPGYVIVDYTAGQIMMVDPQRGEAMSTTIAQAEAAGDDVQVSLRKQGGGPKIAGYGTRKYQLTANGKACGSVYTSKKLLDNGGVRAMFEAMRNMQRASRGMMGGFGGLLSDCQRASMQLSEVLDAAGAPLKIIDENGSVVSEVTRVDTDKKLPASHYRLPAGIKVVDMSERMNQAMQQGQQMMQQMPDMNELMQQMQGSGGEMSEEMQQQMQQQMQQMQKMLEQLQQQ